MEQKIRAQGLPGVTRASGATGAIGPRFLAQRVIDPMKPIMRPVIKRGPSLAKRFRALGKNPLFRPFAALSFLGPGLIAANAGNDAGGITTYAAVGAQYGYSLLWMLIPITISMAVVQEMCARMGAATNKGLSDLIRERFGVRGAAFAVLTLFIANALLTISEFAGIAAASDLLGIPRWVSIPLVVVGLWMLITRGSYGRAEKVFLVMTLAFFAYPIAAFMAQPDWAQVGLQLVNPTTHITNAYLLLFVGTVGTTITPYMQLFIQSSVAEKRIPMETYPEERKDAYTGAIFGDTISAFIIIATGATVFVASHGVGVQLQTAQQAAQALQPLLGKYAETIFAIGLIGASVLAAAVVPLTTAYNVCESFGFEHGVSMTFRQAPIFHGLFIGLLIAGALIALLIPGNMLVSLIIIAQVINGVLLPILLVYIVLLVNDRNIMGEWVNGRVNNAIAYTTVGLLSLLSVIMIVSVVLPLLGVPFLQ